MTSRDLLLEFIQWLVDRPDEFEDIFQDPDVAKDAVEGYLFDENLNGDERLA
jgi:hypothetical protein